MQHKHGQRDFISRAGITMTVIAWLILLAILFGLFEYISTQRSNPNQNIVTTINGQHREITLQRNAYGHYVSSGTINGHDVVFLLDTGATDIAIPEAVADDIGLSKGYGFYVKTANGNARAFRTRLDTVSIGDISRSALNATILTNMTGREVLLGMNFLKHFEMLQQGRTLTIRQPAL